MFDLKEFRKEYKLTQKEIAEIINCGQPNISGMEKDKRDLEPSQRKALVDIYGEDAVAKFESESPYSFKAINDYIEEATQKYTTYLLPMGAAGGSLSGFAACGATLMNCEQIVSPIKEVDFAITVYGESMAPEYPSGSRILIKKIDPSVYIDWGNAYVLDTSNGVIVKEVHESKKEGYIRCHSINPDPKFSDFEVPLSEVYGIYRILLCMAMK